MAELEARALELSQEVARLEQPYKEARENHGKLFKEAHAVKEALDYLESHPDDGMTAKAILAANKYTAYGKVPPERLHAMLQRNYPGMRENAAYFKAQAAELKAPLAEARKARNMNAAKLRAAHDRQQRSREAVEAQSKYALKSDPSRAGSKSDNLGGYGAPGDDPIYDKRERFDARFPNPKDAEAEKVKQFSEQAEAFLQRNPHGGVVIEDRHAHAYSVPSIRRDPSNPDVYVVVEQRFGAMRAQFSSTDMREVATHAINRYGYNEDEYDSLDVEDAM